MFDLLKDEIIFMMMFYGYMNYEKWITLEIVILMTHDSNGALTIEKNNIMGWRNKGGIIARWS